MRLELPDALPGQAQLAADLLKGLRLAGEAVVAVEDHALALGQAAERTPDDQCALVFLQLLLRRDPGIRQQIAELRGVAVRSDGLIEGECRSGEPEGLDQGFDGNTGSLGELLPRRLPSQLGLEAPGGELDPPSPLERVHGNADRAGVVGDRALDRLADPPGSIRREFVASSPVELLDRSVEPDRAFLDQIEEGQAETAVALGDRDDEAEIALDHPMLRLDVAALDSLGQEDLLGRRQQPVGGDLREQDPEAVLGAGLVGNLVQRQLGALDHVVSLQVACGDAIRAAPDPRSGKTRTRNAKRAGCAGPPRSRETEVRSPAAGSSSPPWLLPWCGPRAPAASGRQ